MTKLAVIDEREISITPVFKMMEIENIPKSETAGHAVLEVHEVVEVRFAGQKNYMPVFLAKDFAYREGNRTITYAERWADQYRAFKEGSPQEAMGTPLEMLNGLTPEDRSLCRALRIYSIEALHALEGQAKQSLGMNQNRLKEAAATYMADRASSKNQSSEIEILKARIAELESRSTVPPIDTPTEPEIDAIVQAMDDEFTSFSDDDIKVWITDNTGTRPKGNPSRATLLSMARELAG